MHPRGSGANTAGLLQEVWFSLADDGRVPAQDAAPAVQVNPSRLAALTLPPTAGVAGCRGALGTGAAKDPAAKESSHWSLHTRMHTHAHAFMHTHAHACVHTLGCFFPGLPHLRFCEKLPK